MDYFPPYGSLDPDAPYVDRNTPGAISGSKVPALAIEVPQRELVNLVESSGMTTDAEDRHQVLKAVRSQRANYVPEATGTPNALVVALDPPLAARVPGMPVRVRIAANNTAAATFDAGYGALPIVTMKGAAINQGDLLAGSDIQFIDVGGAWMISGLAYSEVPISLTGDLTVYIRTDGNDGNTGLTNTAGGAFASPNGAIAAVLRRYNAAGYTVTLQLGMPGTYGPASFRQTGAVRFRLLGNVANRNTYIISGAGVAPVEAVSGSAVYLEGVRLQGNFPLTCSGGSSMQIESVVFAQVASISHMFCTYGATIFCLGTYYIATSCTNHYTSGANGSIVMTGAAINILANIAFTQFAVANNGFLAADGAGFFLGAFTVTGIRYNALYGGVIFTAGAGANFFPGNAAGTVSTGGIYA